MKDVSSSHNTERNGLRRRKRRIDCHQWVCWWAWSPILELHTRQQLSHGQALRLLRGWTPFRTALLCSQDTDRQTDRQRDWPTVRQTSSPCTRYERVKRKVAKLPKSLSFLCILWDHSVNRFRLNCLHIERYGGAYGRAHFGVYKLTDWGHMKVLNLCWVLNDWIIGRRNHSLR